MRDDVNLVVAFLRESFPALFTGVRLDVGVCEKVVLQVSPLCKRFVTNIAFERSVSRVHAEMCLQVAWGNIFISLFISFTLHFSLVMKCYPTQQVGKLKREIGNL